MEAPFIDLINSEWRDWKSGQIQDRVDDDAWLGRFLSKWGLQLPPAEMGALRSSLKGLRTLLNSELKRVQSGESLSSEGAAGLGSAISSVRYRNYLSLVPGTPGLLFEAKPESEDSAWAIAQIAESFVDVLSNGDPRRLKNCANPDCGWLFYDDSRAMSRVWCDSRICGNLMKVRRFRARAKKKD